MCIRDRLEVPNAKLVGEWVKISDQSELSWQAAKIPEDTDKIVINAFELSETWPSRVDGIQLQNVKRTKMSDEDCRRYLNLWIALLTEEKRVAKEEEYNFMEHDKLNLPWQFDITGGYKTLPVVIWMKKVAKTSQTEQRHWAPKGSSSSGSTWASWDGAYWLSGGYR